MNSFGAALARPFDVGGRTVRHGEVVPTGEVLALHEVGAVWDTAQGWYVNRQVAFRPIQVDGTFQVVELARLA